MDQGRDTIGERRDYEFVWYGSFIIGLWWLDRDGRRQTLPLNHLNDRPHNGLPATPEQVMQGGAKVWFSPRGGVEARSSFRDILHFYRRQGHITGAQHRAGSKLYRLWYHGCASSPGYVLMRYGEVAGEIDEAAAALLSLEYRNAMNAIRGVPEQRVAYSVCCVGEKAGKRGEMELLRYALADLVRHFGFDERLTRQ